METAEAVADYTGSPAAAMAPQCHPESRHGSQPFAALHRLVLRRLSPREGMTLDEAALLSLGKFQNNSAESSAAYILEAGGISLGL